MSAVAYVQLFLVFVGFGAGFALPVVATLLLERREKRFVTTWHAKGHVAQSAFERKLAAYVKRGSKIAMLCAVAVVALWLQRNL